MDMADKTGEAEEKVDLRMTFYVREDTPVTLIDTVAMNTFDGLIHVFLCRRVDTPAGPAIQEKKDGSGEKAVRGHCLARYVLTPRDFVAAAKLFNLHKDKVLKQFPELANGAAEGGQ
jgi:hypothetical protein